MMVEIMGAFFDLLDGVKRDFHRDGNTGQDHYKSFGLFCHPRCFFSGAAFSKKYVKSRGGIE